MSGNYYSYVFEVKSVQNYLFSSGKLKDMVAASDELDAMTGSVLDETLRVLELDDVLGRMLDKQPAPVNENDGTVYFSRRAGGAIYAVFLSAETRQRFQALWTYKIRSQFPDVECLQVMPDQPGSTPYGALSSALSVLNEKRNIRVPHLPVASPVSMRAQRTGRAAISTARGEALDEVTTIQRKASDKRKGNNNTGLTGKFINKEGFNWPVSFEDDGSDKSCIFPFLPQQGKDIALIHADGNGIGQLLMSLQAVAADLESNDVLAPMRLFREFSRVMETATLAAARDASAAVLEPSVDDENRVPARPLVLGGDDITILCRLDLALPFFKAFTQAFEVASVSGLERLAEMVKGSKLTKPLPKSLTASGGIAVIKANQPFIQCHDLVESLCKAAKKKGKALAAEGMVAPSMVCFHRVAASMIGSVDEVRSHEWTLNEHCTISLEAYATNDATIQPALCTLESMSDLFNTTAELSLTLSPLREIAGLLKESYPQAKKTYLRWREISSKGPRKTALDAFDEYLKNLLQAQPQSSLPLSQTGADSESAAVGISPLADLIAIQHLRSQKEKTHA